MKLSKDERADLFAWCLGFVTALALIQIIGVFQ